MFAIPNFLIFQPFKKAYVKQHMRNGKEIGPYFTKRPPAKVKEKNLTERFIDHSEASARKTHADLEKEKRQHQSIIEALKQHHDELVSKGDHSDGDGKGLSPKEKIAHLKAEIKNQEIHIANKSRKQDLIKNRYEINKKQVAKKQENDLNKKLSQYSEGQQKTIKDIHKANSEGKSKLVPGRILKGKDNDHIYLEAKHKDTGETHHIAIHKDGSLKDPQILHGGKFDSKSLSEPESPKEPKKVKVKEEIKEKKKVPKKGKEISKPNIPEVISKNKNDKSVGNTDQEKIEDWKKNGTKSKAFKDWFGDSKVVDKDGKPLVVYKGMYPYDYTKENEPIIKTINRGEDFPAFNKDEPGVKIAGFFASKPEVSDRFVYKGGSTYPVYLSFQKPYIIDANGEKAGNIQFGESGKPFREAIRSKKYDGVIIKNTEDEGDIFVALKPEQIKSIFNKGTFDKNSDELSKSISSTNIKSDLIKQAKDQVAFAKAIKGGKIEDYEAYINFFPNGKYLYDANKQLTKLKDLKKSVKEKRQRKNKRKKRK